MEVQKKQELEGAVHGPGTNLGLSTDVPPVYEKISMGVSKSNSLKSAQLFNSFLLILNRPLSFPSNMMEASVLLLMVPPPIACM